MIDRKFILFKLIVIFLSIIGNIAESIYKK